MKIKIKGFKSLVKAVRNRAHLVPVMTLINGKFKTYYSKRYVSPGEAMETAKEEFKINPYQEAIFESKDGKVKNLTEKDVLKMYDEAGKPGVLQDFIKKNFKRPKVKASTKDNRQLSFDNMMQGGNKKSKNEEKIDKYLSYYKKENHELDVENLNPIQSGDKQKKEIANKERLSLAFKYNNEIGYMRNNVDSSTNTESLKNDYNRHSKLEEIFNNRNDADYWIGTRNNVYELADLIEYDAEYNKKEQKPENGITITGPIYDDDERPTYYINDNGNVIETQDPKVVEQYRQKQKEANNQSGTDDKANNQNDDNEGKENPGKENKNPQNEITDPKQIIIDKLQQKGAVIWKKGGYERLYFNEVGKEVADRIAKEEGISQESPTYKSLDYFTNKMYLNLRDGKVYIPSNGSKGYELDSKYSKKIVQYVKEIPKNIDTTSNENVKLLNEEGEEKLLEAIGGKVSRGNPYRVYFDSLKMLSLASPGDEKNPFSSRAVRMTRTLDDAFINLITGKITTKSTYNEEIIPRAQKVLDKLISEIKAETEGNEPDLNALAEENQALEEKRAKQRLKENSKEYIEENRKNTTLDDLNARDRFGTKKIESKGEYKQVASINELIDKAKAIKDYHVDVKGRAILDMLGVNIPMYSKRNGKLFPGEKLGYCRSNINDDTGEVIPYEIGIVAETGNSTEETGAIIHEAMHAKIKGISQNILNKCAIKGGLLEKEVQHNVEESLVEMAGFSLSKTIHGSDNYKEIMAYPEEIALTLPRVWDIDEFKTARKTGINGIGKEIYNQIMAGNKEFIDKIANTYASDEAKNKANKRTTAIEKKMLDRTDKLEKITGGNEKSPIGNLVEELKRGTISLEVALNSSKYGVIAAVLITKFLEDEDLDGIDALIGSL